MYWIFSRKFSKVRCMNKSIYILLITFFCIGFSEILAAQDSNERYNTATNIFGVGQIPENYYASVEDANGKQLKYKLHLLTRNHKIFTYDEVYLILEKTDQYPYDTMNVILLYSGRSTNRDFKDRGGRYKYEKHGYVYQDSWNREHVWPKSFGFPNKKDTAYTDLHHIRPADRTFNTKRNNRTFDKSTEPFFDNG